MSCKNSIYTSCLRYVILSLWLPVTILVSNAQSNNLPAIIDTSITEQIQQSLGLDDIDIELTITSNHLPTIISKQHLIDNIILSKPATNSMGGNFKAKIQFNDSSSLTLIGRYTTFTYAPTSSKFLKAGSIVTAEDITLKRVKLRDIRMNNNRDIVGMQVRRNIGTGSIIKPSDLSSPIIIHNNDVVNLLYSSSGITLQTSGIAMENGSAGDTISIKNQKTGVILNGTVINNNLVEIGN